MKNDVVNQLNDQMIEHAILVSEQLADLQEKMLDSLGLSLQEFCAISSGEITLEDVVLKKQKSN